MNHFNILFSACGQHRRLRYKYETTIGKMGTNDLVSWKKNSLDLNSERNSALLSQQLWNFNANVSFPRILLGMRLGHFSSLQRNNKYNKLLHNWLTLFYLEISILNWTFGWTSGLFLYSKSWLKKISQQIQHSNHWIISENRLFLVSSNWPT